MSPKRVLVSGGAGFIGSHLCKNLLDLNYNVICLDNLITGNKNNIVAFLEDENFKFINQDITESVKSWNLDLSEIKYIYHLASPASPVQYQNHPLETLSVNSIGTFHLLNIAKETGVKFLFASTSEVYGDPKEHPQKETYWGNVNSYGPRSCYDEAKRFGEALVYTFIHKYNIDGRIIRIFNTYGPNMEKNDGRVISNFVNQAINNQPLTIYGNGHQTRSFCYVSDLVDGIIKAMENSKTKDEVINLGNPDERSVKDIAELILKITNSISKIEYRNLPTDDPVRRRPDIEKAKHLLSWEPKVNLEAGLEKTISYFRSLQ